MRPFRSFLLLLLVLACLAGAGALFHGPVGFPSYTDFIPLPAQSPSVQDVASFHPGPGARKDTIFIEEPFKLVREKEDSLKGPVSFPEKISGKFDSLSASGSQIRILYYGDSQIEGDRVTSYLRQYLRQRYGGTGPGLILPLMPVMYTKSVYIRSSSNWKRFNYLSFKNGEYNSRALGPFMTVCRFLPAGNRKKAEKAYVRISPSQFADSSAAKFERLRIFYRNTEGKVRVTVSVPGKTILTDTLQPDPGTKELACGLGRPQEVRIDFEGRTSPDISGISIESSNGLVLDNIPQRGSAGLEFTMVDSADLGQDLRLLNPGLIILQYGLNIVRNVRKEYGFYENGLGRQIRRIKNICPRADILVVSLTDMAYSAGDSLLSFPNIGIIRDVQERASSRDGAGFWDSRTAMGGDRSIVRWSKMNPPLAQPDLVHFTNQGADTLSSLLIRGVFSFTDSMAGPKVKMVPLGDTAFIPETVSARDQSLQAANIKVSPVAVIKHIFRYDPSNPFIFTTPGFWLFLLLVMAGYSLVYKKIRLRNLYLLLVSLYFYFKAGGLFLFLLVFVTMVDFTCGLLIYNAKGKTTRKLFIIFSVISNLSLLAYFKYSAFITGSVNSLFGTHLRVFDLLSSLSNAHMGTHFDTSYIILPVGISFFTFQSLSYTIDVYRRRMEPVRNITDFGFYVSFFPHLVAGPIVRASVFMPQVYNEFSLSKREFGHALFVISKGLIKKIIISNFIAITFVDRVFDAPALYSGLENLMAIYGYGLQIYCDFSGYTDIAIGVALLLGFRLPVNFNSPYKASSITDFWQRWHISLSRWLKDYLYISLGGNRKGKIRTYFNLMVTMLLGGLWHGASLRFILWGGMHGAGLVIDRIRKSIFGEGERYKNLARLAGIFITFNFVNFCWIFFRADSMDSAMMMLRQIWNSFSPGSYQALIPAYWQVILLIACGYLIHFIPEKLKESYRGLFIRTPLAGQVAFVLVMAVVLWQMRFAGVQPFIYFRF
ncbi:MAG TPA: MBOAT family O-acyltransferase [Bacteroidales bacterium]|nr:MBOAT family O-acyltransferase [Bacteroidales bacterium]